MGVFQTEVKLGAKALGWESFDELGKLKEVCLGHTKEVDRHD